MSFGGSLRRDVTPTFPTKFPSFSSIRLEILVREPVRRKSYTIKHKWTTVHAVDELVASGLTLSSACDRAGVA